MQKMETIGVSTERFRMGARDKLRKTKIIERRKLLLFLLYKGI